MLGEKIMSKYVEQLLNDKRGQFEDEYGDVIIWFKYEKVLDSWRILMLDKKNREKRIEKLISNTMIEQAKLDILWFEFDNMRRELIK
jgi:hypothetical protein